MKKNKKAVLASILMIGSLPLWGGTGRPSDGMLSFLLLLGFLSFVLGILHLVDHMKRCLRDLLKGMY